MSVVLLALELVLGLLAATVLIPALLVTLQVLLALVPGRARPVASGLRPQVAVLVPAHNEAAGIRATLQAILDQLAAGDRVLVVADNCEDATAAVAAATGAEVIERSDPIRRGKGYALDFGIRYLAEQAPTVVIIVDADCLVTPGSIDQLTRLAMVSQCPAQALYMMQAPPNASIKTPGIKTRIAEFAWMVKNQVRPLGSQRLGLPCQLMGTGMAFPWALISKATLANAELVEDMKLGIDLALAGHPPVFCADALVTSQFPDSAAAAATQRTRWEHGHLGMILAEAPRLLGQAVMRRNLKLLGLALDLAVPPLALLVALLMLLFAVSGGFFLAGFSFWPLLLSGLALGSLTLALLLAWLVWGRSVLPFGDLLSAPLYILGKAPMYLKFWTKRQKEWVRTGRD